MSPEIIDERFEPLVSTLRAETPGVPEPLHDRIAAITSTAPARPRFAIRRLLAFAAPAVVGVSLAAALAVGLTSAFDEPGTSRQEAGPAREQATRKLARMPRASADEPFRPVTATDQGTLAGGPGSGARRAQDVNASLTLLVDGTDKLSVTTQRVLRTTRRLGGYVVLVRYETPEPGAGNAAVRVRIPVSRVQAAIVHFNGLGRILAQETRIADVQQQLDDLTRRIRRAQGNRTRIAAFRRRRAAIARRAAYATVDLRLTTHAPKHPAAAPGRLDRAVDDATGVLAAELAVGAYALIVASPLLVVLLGAIFASRAYRRIADQRLLERA